MAVLDCSRQSKTVARRPELQNLTGSLFIFQFISEWTFCSYGLLTKHGSIVVICFMIVKCYRVIYGGMVHVYSCHLVYGVICYRVIYGGMVHVYSCHLVYGVICYRVIYGGMVHVFSCHLVYGVIC